MREACNLKSISIFQGLLPSQIDKILNRIPPIKYNKREFIYIEGDRENGIYIVQAGMVKVSYVDLGGTQKVLTIVQSGDVFGNLSLGNYHGRVGNAEALSDVTLLHLPESNFFDLIESFPAIALNFIRYQSDAQRETVARLHSLMSMDARHRILGTLLSLVRRCYHNDSGWFLLPGDLTQEDIANMTGLNRSTVNLVINHLRQEGLLGGSGRSLTVNRSAIEQALECSGAEILE